MKVVILTAQCFQDEEYLYSYYRLTEEGIIPDVFTPTGESVIGKYGVPTKGSHIHIQQLQSSYYDAVVIPGGFEAPGRLRTIPEVIRFVKEMNSYKKPIGAICHGPQVLISAEIVKNRRMTAYMDVNIDLINAGAILVHMGKAVIDKNIVTSSHYNYNGPFMAAFVGLLHQKQPIH